MIEAINQARKKGDRELVEYLVAEYRMFNGNRFVLLINRRRLVTKNEAAREHNKMLY